MIRWFRNEQLLDTSVGHESNFGLESNNSLVIFNTDESSGGKYKCEITTDLDTEEVEHTLKVYKRSRFQSHPQHATAIQGENVTLICEAEIDENLLESFKIIWRLNREPILLP